MIYEWFTFNFLRWTTATLVRRKGIDGFVALVKGKHAGMRLNGRAPTEKQWQAFVAGCGRTSDACIAPG